MKRVELYGRVRHAVMIEGLSQREAARCFGIDPRTVRKMLSYSVPPGYVRTRPPVRPKLDPFIGIIDRILEEDKDRPKKQRHTSKRIFERLRDEYGFTGKITIVKDYICGVRQRRREMFVPLTHPPGHAQVDFGEALAVIGGVERKIHFLAMSLPHSDACFVKAYPGETTEAFCDGHVSGFSFFGGVPRSILYDNTRIAVARILGDGKRQRTRVFSELYQRSLIRTHAPICALIFHGWSMRLFQAWQHSAVFVGFEDPVRNQLSRMNCQTTGFNSGDRGGSARTVMLSGIASLGVKCQPA